ncbi:MAG: hypothetical protein JJ879_04355 [Sneathiella sp.]|nr:hypothetical protein [Sneathiella sp.]
MARTGIKVTSNTDTQNVYLTLFDGADPSHRLTVSLDPDKVLQLAGRLLNAGSELDINPSEETVKALLQIALASLTSQENITKN